MGNALQHRSTSIPQAAPAPMAQASAAMPDNSQVQEIMRAPQDVGVIPQTALGGQALDLYGLSNQMMQPGAIQGTESVSDMVDQVQDRTGESDLGHLQIFGHGNEGLQFMASGDEYGRAADGSLAYATADKLCDPGVEDPGCDPVLTAALAELGPMFDEEEGRATLHGCHAGYGPEGEALVRELAELWDVPVSAADAVQRGLPGLEGDEITCTPSPEGTTCTRTDLPMGLHLPSEAAPKSKH